MNKLALLMLPLLVGCSDPSGVKELGEARPVAVPALPDDLAEPAKKLPPITSPRMSDQLEDAIETDRAYNALAHRYNALLSVYGCVREALNDQKDAADCLGK